jgi:hypothetical protein
MEAKPTITRAEFDFLARRAGLALTEPQKVELYAAYATLEMLVARLRTGLPLEAEPATIMAIDADAP